MTKDQYLTEKVLEKCWHEWEDFGSNNLFICNKLGCRKKSIYRGGHDPLATPEGFFALWDAAKENDWWDLFLIWTINLPSGCESDERWVDWYINPLRFRDALYDFLKGRES